MKCKIYFLKFFISLILLFHFNVQGNNTTTKSDIMPEAATFESGKFYNINAGGDLSLNIPLMKVPGRNGYDFDLSLNYSAGIKVAQKASWIGLGWDLPIGSITRLPQGVRTYNFCDFADKPNGQPDIYMVNMPGGCGKMFPINSENSYPDFVFEEFKAWKVETEIQNPVTVDGYNTQKLADYTPTDRADYSKFTIITEDGTKYIFAQPLLSTVETYFNSYELNGVSFAENGWTETYVVTWLLTSIESPDYKDNGATGYDDADDGNWIKIEYRYNSTNSIVTFRHPYPSNRYLQLTYPYIIETPTHKVEFETFTRANEVNFHWVKDDYSFDEKPKGLQYLKLYSKAANGELVKQWTFVHEYSLCSYGSSGKLTLLSFYETDGTISKPPYEIVYQDNNPLFDNVYKNTGTDEYAHLYHAIDDFGYYRLYAIGIAQPDAWAIKELKTPLGKIIRYEFENDYFRNPKAQFTIRVTHIKDGWNVGDLNTKYPASSTTSNERYQGGGRIKRITYLQNNDTTKIVDFDYHDGSVGGLLTGYPVLYHQKLDQLYVGYSNADRGQNRIVYPKITKLIKDKDETLLGKNISYYTTNELDNSKYGYNTTAYIIWEEIGAPCTYKYINILEDNKSWNWGRLYKKEEYNQSNSIVRKDEYSYDETIMDIGHIAHDYRYDCNDFPFMNLFSHMVQLSQTTTNKYFDSGQLFTVEDRKYSFEKGLIEKSESNNSNGDIKKYIIQYYKTPVGRSGTIKNKELNNINNISPSSVDIPYWDVTSPSGSYELYADNGVGEDKVIWFKAGKGHGNDYGNKEVIFQTVDKIPVVGNRYYKIYLKGYIKADAYNDGIGNSINKLYGPSAASYSDIIVKVDKYNNNDVYLGEQQINEWSVESEWVDGKYDYETLNVNNNIEFLIAESECSKIQVRVILKSYTSNGGSTNGWLGITEAKFDDIDLLPGSIKANHGTKEFILANRNQLNLLSLKKIYNDNSLVGRTDYLYHNFDTSNDNIQLKKIENWIDKDEDHLVDSGEWITNKEFIKYNSHGNLLEEDANGTTTTTKWSYNSSVPIAQIINSTDEETIVDDFGDGSITDSDPINWYITGDYWEVIDGTLTWTQINNSLKDCSISRQMDLTNFIAEFDIKVNNAQGGGDWGGFHFRKIDETHQITSTGSSGYLLLLRQNGIVELFRLNPLEVISSRYELADRGGDWSFIHKEWHHFRVEGQGSNIKIYVDGSLIFDINDTRFDGTNSYSAFCTYKTESQFDNIRIYPLDAICTSQSYDPMLLQVNRYIDENGNATYYEYDDFGRLEKVKNNNSSLISDYDYYYSRDGNGGNYEANDPNRIITKSYFSDSDPNPIISTSYFDGLGRNIQNRLRYDYSEDIVIAIDYDEFNRPVKNWKPYIQDAGYWCDIFYPANAKAHYDGNPGPDCDDNPYTETVYRNAFSDEVSETGAPGDVFKVGSGHTIRSSYYANDAVDGFDDIGEYFETRIIDENNVLTEQWTDKFGNMVGTSVNRTDTSGQDVNLTTQFEYDILGNLIKVIPPKGFTSSGWNISKIPNPDPYSTFMKYNTLGQLMAKATPDLDGDGNGNPTNEDLENPDIRYKYDKNGNLRFVQDANHKQNSEIIYYSYDVFNRKIKEGVASISNWDNLDPDINNAFENSGIKISFDYDGENAYPDSRNLKARISRIKYLTKDQWSYTYYSYNHQGQVEYLVNDIMGALEKKIEYEYDLQGNVMKVIYDKDGSDELHFWHEYNDLSQLEKIYSSSFDIKPEYADVYYEYWPTGQVKTLKLSESSGQNYAEEMNYNYNERDWLIGINAPLSYYDPLTSDSKFAMHLYYNTGDGTPLYNGNISAADYYTERPDVNGENPIDSYSHRYKFLYDEINRLISAGYYYDAAGWFPDNAYNLQDISYDPVGNINTLTRKNESGSGNPYTYHYKSSSNQLDYVGGYNSQTTGNYHYDYNGNLIKDNSKDISGSNIKYDYRNLPTEIEFEKNDYTNKLNYAYDFAGNRIYKKLSSSGGAEHGQIYIYDKDGRTLAVYDLDGNLKFINLYGLDLIGRIE